MRILLDKLS